MKRNLTLGSLFSGSGGFELAGTLAGITPVWNSEIESFPIRVTHKRFPNTRHYGNVKNISGKTLEPVDIITFGSPCQNLSMAGNRQGLEGKESGLFREAIRIIREMGKNQEPLSWTKEIPFLLRGEPLTPNLGESPNAVEESSLSRILQDKVPCKYYLSRKACPGILRRAEARGKELPGLLREALIRQAQFA